jgi:hypothetical protein
MAASWEHNEQTVGGLYGLGRTKSQQTAQLFCMPLPLLLLLAPFPCSGYVISPCDFLTENRECFSYKFDPDHRYCWELRATSDVWTCSIVTTSRTQYGETWKGACGSALGTGCRVDDITVVGNRSNVTGCSYSCGSTDNSDRTIAIALLVVGGVLAVPGTVLWIRLLCRLFGKCQGRETGNQNYLTTELLESGRYDAFSPAFAQGPDPGLVGQPPGHDTVEAPQ